MRRALLAALAIALAGCGFMQVGERPIPSVPGAVAATEWQPQDPTLPGDVDLSGATTPEDFLEGIVTAALSTRQERSGVRYGVLERAGDRATAYLQLTGEQVRDRPAVAFEAHLTLARGADGGWTLSAVMTRDQCGEPLTNGACGDNSGGGAPAPQP